jgi:mono/diheme cytochrome c family protein
MGKAILLLGLTAFVYAGCASSTAPAPATSPVASSTPPATDPAGGGDPSGTHYAAIQAILTGSCSGCHGAGRPKAGINLTTYADVMKGGREGAIVKAGDPANSVLVKALKGAGARQMPPRGKLDDAKVKAIEAWIKAGAKNS